jgi:hypothetical protein
VRHESSRIHPTRRDDVDGARIVVAHSAHELDLEPAPARLRGWMRGVSVRNARKPAVRAAPSPNRERDEDGRCKGARRTFSRIAFRGTVGGNPKGLISTLRAPSRSALRTGGVRQVADVGGTRQLRLADIHRALSQVN